MIAVGLGDAPETGFLPEGTTFLNQDILLLDDTQLDELFTGVDVLIHGAGADGRNLFARPAIDGFRKENVDPFRRIIPSLKRVGAKKLLILGSYYTAMHRMFPGLKLDTISPYIQSRVEQNQVAFELAGDDMDVTILELPYIFGAAPGRGTLWGFYIDRVRNATDVIPVHAGGSACVTMNQVGLATAHAVELSSGLKNYPLSNCNLSYEEIFTIFAEELGLERTFQKREPEFFRESAEKQLAQIEAAGKEAAYHPLGLLEMEDQFLYIDPIPSMQALSYPAEDIRKAIRESIEATLQQPGKGPGQRSS